MWEGEWRCGKRDGPGVMNHADGRTIESEWHADVLQGPGNRFKHFLSIHLTPYQHDLKYVLEHTNTITHNHTITIIIPQLIAFHYHLFNLGVCRFANGDVFCGEFLANEMHGPGDPPSACPLICPQT